ncbi:MAG: hypothetical protein EHM45_18150 [Desulfobacteraceae bacterium]|nr:MAG: hypothetical protein EHM45_18150 [Desulfobacteraceae bacterium]
MKKISSPRPSFHNPFTGRLAAVIFFFHFPHKGLKFFIPYGECRKKSARTAAHALDRSNAWFFLIEFPAEIPQKIHYLQNALMFALESVPYRKIIMNFSVIAEPL